MVHFAPPGVRGCAVAFSHARDALGRGNTEKYGTSSWRYAGGRIEENVASYQQGVPAVGTAVENTKTRGPRTLALCLTAAVEMTLAIFCRLVSKTHCCTD